MVAWARRAEIGRGGGGRAGRTAVGLLLEGLGCVGDTAPAPQHGVGVLTMEMDGPFQNSPRLPMWYEVISNGD